MRRHELKFKTSFCTLELLLQFCRAHHFSLRLKSTQVTKIVTSETFFRGPLPTLVDHQVMTEVENCRPETISRWSGGLKVIWSVFEQQTR